MAQTDQEQSAALAALADAVKSRHLGAIEAACTAFNRAIPFVHPLAETTVAQLVAILFGPSARALPTGAGNLLMPLNWRWPRFAPEQREWVLAAIESAFDGFADPQAPGIMVELIADHVLNRRGLQALNRLRHAEDPVVRGWVVHGYHHLAIESPDDRVARNAAEMVMALADDPAADVRRAARHTLDVLTRAGRWDDWSDHGR